jgi:alpha-galactosidase
MAAALGVAAIVLSGCGAPTDQQVGGTGVAIPSVAALPPMGWNSWNSFGCDIDERKIEAQADAMVSSGLAATGYRYVVVDDCWYSPDRAADGSLKADPGRFPSGMAVLADRLHAQGLQLGIYAGASDRTCAQLAGAYPGTTGSEDHEQQDARTFADWGVDFVKYDWCSDDADIDRQERDFTAMRDAIRATGRAMVYSINPNSGVGATLPGAQHDWGGVATMTRITNDITAAWSTGQGPAGYQGVHEIIDAAGEVSDRVSAGRWIDPDMLEIGVGDVLTPAQQRSHLAMWSMMAAPLIAGNNLTQMSPATAALLTNSGIIEIDQDPLGRAASPTDLDNNIWTRPLADGALAVALFNPGDTAREMAVTPADLGVEGTVTDVWTGEPVTSAPTITIAVAPGDTAVLRIGPPDVGGFR